MNATVSMFSSIEKKPSALARTGFAGLPALADSTHRWAVTDPERYF
jgi:hypothetical protein